MKRAMDERVRDGAAVVCGKRAEPETSAGQPLVSVVIPTFNRAARLARAIRSVQSQSYSRLEIIVVDDGSTDATAEIVHSCEDRRIRYIRHEQNRGGAAARNTGIAAANGEVIAFLDDDDAWVPEKVEEQLRYLTTFDAVVCTSREAGDTRPPERRPAGRTLGLADLRLGPWGGTGVLMARASVLRRTPFDESLPRGQDWDLFIRLAQEHEIAYLHKPLLVYDGGAHDRITNSLSRASVLERTRQLRVIEKHRVLFGDAWYHARMCEGLLYDFAGRPDKFTILAYAGRQHGWFNVFRVLALRLRERMRHASFRLGTSQPHARGGRP